MIAPTSFDELVRHRATPCVSIILPVDRRHPDERSAHLLLKQLVADARSHLVAAGVGDIDTLLAPTDEVVQRSLIAEHSGGLGLFLAPGFAREHAIDTPVEAMVAVDDRFSIGSIVPVVAAAPMCHVLSLGAEHVSLSRVSGLRWTECDVPDLPHAVDEALWFERVERSSGSHAGGPVDHGAMSIIGHGTGAQAEDRKERLSRFFHLVDEAVLHHLRTDPDGPLVVAGTHPTVSRYEHLSRHRHVIVAPVGSPHELTARVLHDRVDQLLQPVVAASHRAHLDRLADRLGTGLAAVDLAEIDGAASSGRVSDLLIASTAPRWMTASSPAEPLDDWQPGATDAVNRIIGEVWQYGGRLHCVSAGQLPDGAGLAALYRY